MWFLNRQKKDKHIHCFGNWHLFNSTVGEITDGLGHVKKQYRVLEQSRQCGLCGYIEIDAQKVVVGSINIDDIGRNL